MGTLFTKAERALTVLGRHSIDYIMSTYYSFPCTITSLLLAFVNTVNLAKNFVRSLYDSLKKYISYHALRRDHRSKYLDSFLALYGPII